jgi:hypothetical protein
MTTSTQKFAEYLSGFEQNRMSMRLGHTVYVEQGKDIFAEDRKTGELEKVTLEELVSKPWIRENFERERTFQRRKALAIGLQSTHIPLHERRAYKKRWGLRGNIMTNSNNQTQNSAEHSINVLQQIQLELKAPKSKRNSFGNYNYRNCEDILEAVKPLLQKYNSTLIITDEVQEVGSVVVVTAKVIFTDSNGKETVVKAHAGVEISKKGMDVAQTFGASSSYARKYALNGLFLIDDTKDYDSDEYHNQVNNSTARNNNQQNSRQSQQAAPQNNQQPAQQQPNAQQKPKRTQAQLFNDALTAIKGAENKEILKAAANRFKGTTYEAGITNACRARADQMGWPTQSKTQQNNQPNQMRH